MTWSNRTPAPPAWGRPTPNEGAFEVSDFDVSDFDCGPPVFVNNASPPPSWGQAETQDSEWTDNHTPPPSWATES